MAFSLRLEGGVLEMVKHHSVRPGAILAGVLLLLLPFPSPANETPRDPKRHRIGYRILKVPRPGEEALTLALWYPTDAGPGRMTYAVVGSEMVSDASPDAPPAKGPFPLLIYSHGGGGCAIMGATHAEALAENGFVVAGPDYSDDFVVARSDGQTPSSPSRVLDWLSWARSVSGGIQAGKMSTRFAHRPKEARVAVDYLLRESANPRSALGGIIDPEKIGAFGVSFGAWTTQALAGFHQGAFRDDRIKAAVPIAGSVSTGKAGDFANIEIPVMFVFGEEETVVLGDPSSGPKLAGMLRNYESANPPKFLIEIRGARHLDFGGAGVSRREKGAAATAFSTAEVRNNDRVIGTVNHYCIAFFRRYLLSDPAAEDALKTSGPNLVLLKHDTRAR
jgi:predicted dienelactone hydrolase